jgi:hypothetical protein
MSRPVLPVNARSVSPCVQIEPAYDCDGSLCHQPLFDEDGGLHYVAPHCHLIESGANGPHCYAVFCDFPSVASKA